jgi:alpha-1,3-rhamnosyl/mannosyltransferase
VPLVIAGGSNRFLSESELHEPQRQGIADWVRWIGWLDNAELPAVYRSRKLCCCRRCTSRSACPSWKRWRAAVRRSRRIATAHWNSRRGASVLVEPESIDDIAAGIVRLLEDQPLRATLRRAGTRARKALHLAADCCGSHGVLESLPRLSRRRAAPCASDELGEHADSDHEARRR